MVAAVDHFARAACLLDEAAAGARRAVDHRLPVLFRRDATFERRGAQLAIAIDQAAQAAELLQAAGSRGTHAAIGIRELVDDVRVVLERQPFRDARHAHKVQTAPSRLEAMRERTAVLARLDGLDDVAARRTVEHEVEAVLGAYLDGDPAARRAIAARAGLPEPLQSRYLQTRFGASVLEVHAASARPSSSLVDDDLLVEARAALDRHALARLSSSDRRALVDALLARDLDSLSRDEVRQLAVAASLPEELVPEPLRIASLREPRRLHDILARHETLVNGHPMRFNDDSFLHEIEGARLVARGEIPDRRAATNELMRLLDHPTSQITPAMQRRIGVLIRLPEELRPPLPVNRDAWALRSVGLRGEPRVEQHERALDAARVFYGDVRNPQAGLAQLRATIEARTGGFDIDRLPALLADPDAVAAAGITDEMLDSLFLAELARAGDADVRGAHLRRGLEVAQASLSKELPDERFDSLRRESLELVERNIARIDGTRLDTFARHPDYAEVGRITANLRLLERAASAPSPSAGRTLTW